MKQCETCMFQNRFQYSLYSKFVIKAKFAIVDVMTLVTLKESNKIYGESGFDN